LSHFLNDFLYSLKGSKMDRRSFLTKTTAATAAGLSMPLFAGIAKANPPLRGKFAGDQFEYLDSSAPAPNLVFQDANGRDTSVSDYRGRIIIATIWATWCGVCTHEMPTINQAAGLYSTSQVIFMPISIDDRRTKISSYYRSRNLNNLGVFHDPEKMSLSFFGARGTPTSFIIDQHGDFRGRFEGMANWSSPDAKALINYFVSQL
jgi:thiol-disulfide isomerase/thioredoxin